MKHKNFTYHTDGFVGHMAIPDHKTEHAVIVIMGGEKSLLPGVKIAERFADYDIAGLSVSLFGAAGLPDSPNQIPLEMLGRALAYLKEAGYTHISTYGMSMGTIFAALCSIYFDGIENVILVSPRRLFFFPNSVRSRMII